MSYKSPRARAEFEWRALPPCRGGKEGGKGRGKEEEGKIKRKKRKSYKQTIKTTIIKKQPLLTKTSKA